MANKINIWDGTEIDLSTYSTSQLESEIVNLRTQIDSMVKLDQTPMVKSLIKSFKLNVNELTLELSRRCEVKHPLNGKVYIRKYRNLQNNADVISVKKFRYSTIDDKYTIFTDIVTILDSDGIYSGKYQVISKNNKLSYRFNPISIISDVYSVDEDSDEVNYILNYWVEMDNEISDVISGFGVKLESFINNTLNIFKSKDYD